MKAIVEGVRRAGQKVAGHIDQRLYPRKGRRWGGPFNGQRGRCLLFAELIERIGPHFILETGCYRGSTTEWMSAFQLPIYTVEGHPENYGFARARLRHITSIELSLDDSRAFLRRMIRGPLVRRLDEPCIAYLDAHWRDDLPLAEELDILFTSLPKAVAMIDDFEVADDPDYTFDDYGPGKALTAAYIQPAVEKFGLAVYYPSLPGREETGIKRGCAVLARRDVWETTLDTCRRLKRSAT